MAPPPSSSSFPRNLPCLAQAHVGAMVSSARQAAQDRPMELAAAGVAVAGMLWYSRVRSARAKALQRDCKDFEDVVTGSARILSNKDSVLKRDEVKAEIDGYENLFKGARKETGAITSEESVAERNAQYQTMINAFYNLVTDFYEWGWGQSFHFAPRWKGETFMESIKRLEHFLCLSLGLKKGMKALDVGCGVGGPMRNMAIFSGATIEGITINQYQVTVGNKYNAGKGLAELCHITKGDFQTLPFPDSSFDRAYAIEATCHSPDRVGVFSEVARVLKPGGEFAGFDWVVLRNYDPNNSQHVMLKEGIEVGNGLPTLVTPEDVVKALEASGFEVLEHYDANEGLHSPHQISWYATLAGSMTLSGFRMTRAGRRATHALVWVLETLRIAPHGSTQVSALLNKTANDLVDSGKLDIFTPSYFFHARKR